jgi:acetyl-CoA carboxylase biotin carboxyl carrier protein
VPDQEAAARSAAGRRADHRAVEQLATDLIPDLIARLSTSGLAELEVREDAWRVRLRRPLTSGTSSRPAADRSSTDRPHRLAASATVGATGPSAGQVSPGRLSASPAHGPGARDAARSASGADIATDGSPGSTAQTVTSPAVGIFRPRADLPGTTVRAGDRLGIVDMLGIPQEVVAPVDGRVGEFLAQPGDGVEYGQALFAMEPRPAAEASRPIPVESEETVTTPAGDRT